MKINMLERISLLFSACILASIIEALEIMDYEIAFSLLVATGFIMLAIHLYYKACFPEVSIFGIFFKIASQLFLGAFITALILSCIQSALQIDIYNYLKAKPYMIVLYVIAVTTLLAYIVSSFSKDENKKVLQALILNVFSGLAITFVVTTLINYFFKHNYLTNIDASMSLFLGAWQVEIKKTNEQEGNNLSINDYRSFF